MSFPRPAQVLREHKRSLDKSIRELDRERTALEQQEKKLIVEIKRMAKQNQMASTRVMAKDLIRVRHSITKFHGLKSQLQGVSLKMQTLKSTQAMAEAMRCACLERQVAGERCRRASWMRTSLTPLQLSVCRGVSRAMAGMNKQLNLPTLQNTLREFEKQSERMDMTSEVIGRCEGAGRSYAGCSSTFLVRWRRLALTTLVPLPDDGRRSRRRTRGGGRTGAPAPSRSALRSCSQHPRKPHPLSRRSLRLRLLPQEESEELVNQVRSWP